MNVVAKWFKEQAKTIAAFVAGFVGNMIVSLVDGTTPFPQTKQEWMQYLLTSGAAGFAAYMARNKITQKQLDADDHVLGGIVVDQKVDPASSRVPDPVPDWAASKPPLPAPGAYVNPFPDPTGLS